MNSDYFTICASGFETKLALDEMVDPSLYSSLDSDSPNGQFMYESVADFCLQSSGNLTSNTQKLNIVFPQAQQHFLQPIQFNQHLNLSSYENSSLISPTIEELTFEDCCSEMLKLIDESDINSLADINTSLQNEMDLNKVNFQVPSQPSNNNLAQEYILRNLYDFDDSNANNMQENLLLNNNLTLAQLNGPDFGLNSFDRSHMEEGQSLKVMPLENLIVGNNITTVNTVIIEPKLMLSSLSGINMKQEPEDAKLFTVAYSNPGINGLSSETKLFMTDGFDPPNYHSPQNKVILSSTLSQNQLKSILKNTEMTTKTLEGKSESVDEMVTNNVLKQDVHESMLEAYLLSPQKEQPYQQTQPVDTYEDFGALWDICDEEEALSINCDKKEVTPDKPNTRKARKHLDSETSVDIMTGDDSDDQYQVSDDEDEAAEFLMDLKSKDEGQRFFWQYNVLSKGPKGRRLCQSIDNPDPHILGDFQDPVFHQEQDRYKHNGKARRGDGNDVTPNPQKLFSTGIELQKLNKQINIMAPCNDWPTTQKNKTLKERNKLASRACRLKKKAQHEANKLKLHGLKMEHDELMKAISVIREMLAKKVRNKVSPDASMLHQFNVCLRKHHAQHVAGRTADYVNTILAKVASGDKTGGINLRN